MPPIEQTPNSVAATNSIPLVYPNNAAWPTLPLQSAANMMQTFSVAFPGLLEKIYSNLAIPDYTALRNALIACRLEPHAPSVEDLQNSLVEKCWDKNKLSPFCRHLYNDLMINPALDVVFFIGELKGNVTVANKLITDNDTDKQCNTIHIKLTSIIALRYRYKLQHLFFATHRFFYENNPHGVDSSFITYASDPHSHFNASSWALLRIQLNEFDTNEKLSCLLDNLFGAADALLTRHSKNSTLHNNTLMLSLIINRIIALFKQLNLPQWRNDILDAANDKYPYLIHLGHALMDKYPALLQTLTPLSSSIHNHQ